MNGKFKAKYISNILSSDFVQGEIYDGLYYAKDSKNWICYEDKNGDGYALPAERFEIIRDEKGDK